MTEPSTLSAMEVFRLHATQEVASQKKWLFMLFVSYTVLIFVSDTVVCDTDKHGILYEPVEECKYSRYNSIWLFANEVLGVSTVVVLLKLLTVCLCLTSSTFVCLAMRFALRNVSNGERYSLLLSTSYCIGTPLVSVVGRSLDHSPALTQSLMSFAVYLVVLFDGRHRLESIVPIGLSLLSATATGGVECAYTNIFLLMFCVSRLRVEQPLLLGRTSMIATLASLALPQIFCIYSDGMGPNFSVHGLALNLASPATGMAFALPVVSISLALKTAIIIQEAIAIFGIAQSTRIGMCVFLKQFLSRFEGGLMVVTVVSVVLSGLQSNPIQLVPGDAFRYSLPLTFLSTSFLFTRVIFASASEGNSEESRTRLAHYLIVFLTLLVMASVLLHSVVFINFHQPEEWSERHRIEIWDSSPFLSNVSITPSPSEYLVDTLRTGRLSAMLLDALPTCHNVTSYGGSLISLCSKLEPSITEDLGSLWSYWNSPLVIALLEQTENQVPSRLTMIIDSYRNLMSCRANALEEERVQKPNSKIVPANVPTDNYKEEEVERNWESKVDSEVKIVRIIYVSSGALEEGQVNDAASFQYNNFVDQITHEFHKYLQSKEGEQPRAQLIVEHLHPNEDGLISCSLDQSSQADISSGLSDLASARAVVLGAGSSLTEQTLCVALRVRGDGERPLLIWGAGGDAPAHARAAPAAPGPARAAAAVLGGGGPVLGGGRGTVAAAWLHDALGRPLPLPLPLPLGEPLVLVQSAAAVAAAMAAAPHPFVAINFGYAGRASGLDTEALGDMRVAVTALATTLLSSYNVLLYSTSARDMPLLHTVMADVETHGETNAIAIAPSGLSASAIVAILSHAQLSLTFRYHTLALSIAARIPTLALAVAVRGAAPPSLLDPLSPDTCSGVLRAPIQALDQVAAPLLTVLFTDLARRGCYYGRDPMAQLTIHLQNAIKLLSKYFHIVVVTSSPDDLQLLQSLWWNLRQQMRREQFENLSLIQHVPEDECVFLHILRQSDGAITFSQHSSSLAVAAHVPFLQIACDSGSIEFADQIGMSDHSISIDEIASGQTIVNLVVALVTEQSDAAMVAQLRAIQAEQSKLYNRELQNLFT